MKYSLLLAFAVVALLLVVPSQSSALESCYQICTPSTPCSTPCMDPWRPYLGPLACGAGFSCKRGAHDGIFNDEAALISEFTTDQAACTSVQSEDVPVAPTVQSER